MMTLLHTLGVLKSSVKEVMEMADVAESSTCRFLVVSFPWLYGQK